ncbi:hypothetical protein [Nocardia farcinica]|uniref:hypothetical protein n=1 Tax=Nocardia farcinica TaxID=37329 RepID=UPI003D795812
MDEGTRRRERGQLLVAGGYSAALTLLIGGPLLGPGYLLLRDAVSTPRSYPTDSALGLGDAAPRAVPQDALLATVATVIDGGLAVKAILVLALWAAGFGSALLVRALLSRTTLTPGAVPLAAQLVAVTVTLWNPYVAERLLQGHWSLLTGYAALPWTVWAAHRIRAAAGRGGARMDGIGHWAALAACLAVAGLTPTGALLAALVAVVTIGVRRVPATLALTAVASAPWLVATALSGGGADPSDPAGASAFAARAEPRLGTLGSLAGLGGIWNADAVPASRTTLLAAVGTIALLAVVATGVRATRTAPRAPSGAVDLGHAGVEAADADPARSIRRSLLWTAAAAVALPALAATPWGIAVMEALLSGVPGAGLLRDTQKYVALAVPGYALCAAAGCLVVAARVRRAGVGAGLVGVAFVAAVVVPLLDLAWGVGGQMRAVRYPAGWERVAAEVRGPADVAVLPGGMFRKFPDSGTAPVLDPAPRMLPADVLQTGELRVRGRTVAGEGTRAVRVERLLLDGAPARELAARGVGWVLVERTSPGPLGESARTLAELERVYADDDLALYRVPAPADGPSAEAVAAAEYSASPARRGWAWAAHGVWVSVLVGGAAVAGWARTRRGRRSPEPGV